MRQRLTRQPTVLDSINLQDAQEFSRVGHRSEAVDYLCLFRSTGLTIKVYFFDDGVETDIVVPHTHRYDFTARVVCGHVREVRYSYADPDEPGSFVTSRWVYNSPVEGGNGFELDVDDDHIVMSANRIYVPGGVYTGVAHSSIHTLTQVFPGTIVMVYQYADVGADHMHAWSAEKPKIEGSLGRKMSAEEVLKRARQLQRALDPENAT